MKKLKQSISFQKNHDIFSLIKAINLTKTKNKQNFVRRKIAVWAFGINFELYIVIYDEIIYIQKQVLFFSIRKFCVKRG